MPTRWMPVRGLTTPRPEVPIGVHGDLLTSADARYADSDPVEVYRIHGIDVVLDDRQQYDGVAAVSGRAPWPWVLGIDNPRMDTS